jgi:hypothetical protein
LSDLLEPADDGADGQRTVKGAVGRRDGFLRRLGGDLTEVLTKVLTEVGDCTSESGTATSIMIRIDSDCFNR